MVYWADQGYDTFYMRRYVKPGYDDLMVKRISSSRLWWIFAYI